MLKKLTCLALAFFLCVGAIIIGTPVNAASEMKTSDACITVIKLEEGFSKTPYWDYAQYTVGYGTRCPEDMRNYYTQNGITVEEAETLLRNHLLGVERELNNFLNKNGLTFNQGQFDAMVSLSYNCGTSWMYSTTGNLTKAVLNQKTGSEFLRAISLWCTAGGEVKSFLLRRRLSEANMYLNGAYSKTPPENFAYTLLDANGGSVQYRVQGYDAATPTDIYETPTYSGNQFAGWYTQASGGTKVTKLDASTKGATLYAHWTDAKGNNVVQKQDQPTVTGTVKVSSTLNVRSGAGTAYPSVGSLRNGAKVTITEQKTVGTMVWGKTSSGWISLSYVVLDKQEEPKPTEPKPTEPAPTEPKPTEPKPTEPAPTEPKPTEPKPTEPAPTEPKPTEPPKQETWTGTVKVSGSLNVRSGAGTNYSKVGSMRNGSRVTITEKKTVGSMVWGKTSSGWICMSYVVLDSTNNQQPSQPQNNTTKITGTVVVGSTLNVRKGAGTNYAKVGTLKNGTKVEILEKKTVGNITWGRISSGWISMQYVKVDGSNTQQNTQPAQPSQPNQTTAKTGTVKVGSVLNVRKGAGTNYAVVATLRNGTRVTITETKNVGSVTWGKVSSGWISLAYVTMN